MKKILVLGGNGMLGHMLCKILIRRGYEVITTKRLPNIKLPMREDNNFLVVDRFNAYKPERAITKLLKTAEYNYDVDTVVNAIGLVKQKSDIDNYDYSVVNALFPHILADSCEQFGMRLIHVSTDCVFSGAKGMYREEDIPSPIDSYGASKLLGELDKPNTLTLRTSLIGWEIDHYWGVLSWFAKQRGNSINGYINAIFSGFSTSAFSNIIVDIIEKHPALSGLYHVASNSISKYALLSRLRDVLEWDIEINSVEKPYINRSLDATRFREMTGIEMPSWESMIVGLVEEFKDYKYD